MTKKFIFSLHVYTEDTDFGGVVYHANYLKFMERARTTLAMELGWRLDELAVQDHVYFVVRNVIIDYLFPGRLHDVLEVVSYISKIGKTSLTFQQDIRLATQPERWITKGSVTLVTINTQTFKPCALPARIAETIYDH